MKSKDLQPTKAERPYKLHIKWWLKETQQTIRGDKDQGLVSSEEVWTGLVI